MSQQNDVRSDAAEIFPAQAHDAIVSAAREASRWLVANDGPPDDIVLNACRTRRLLDEGVWSSKVAAGAWAATHVGDAAVVEAALSFRRGNGAARAPETAAAFAERLLGLSEPFGAEEDRPRLDARRHEVLGGHPRVVGQPAVDLGLAVCVDHQQHVDAFLLAPRERSAEQDEPVVCERVHERRVLTHSRLRVHPSVRPAWSGVADDGEVAHVEIRQARRRSVTSGYGPCVVLLIRAALLGAIVLVGVSAAPAHAAKHCDEPRTRWQRATPAEAGMDAAKLAAAVRAASASTSVAVRVYRHGCLVAEDALNPERVGIPFQSFSLAKSVTSMIFGRAWTLGLIGPDDPVGSLFPEADAPHGALLVRHLATMTTGNSQQFLHDFNLAMADRVRDALTIPLVEPPGETFNYWQTGPAMLAASVARAAGEDFQAFAQRELFGPIGIRRNSWLWTGDLKGNTAGFWGLWMPADDYARIGELLRREGVWRGRRLLSERYVHDALQPIKPFGCYAMLIWRQATPRCNWPVHLGLPQDMWQFNGAQGQIVTTFPTQGVMVARAGVDASMGNWAVGGDASGAAERAFHDGVLAAITDTPVKIEHPPRDPSRPNHLVQQRPSKGDEVQGGLASVVQPALPPAGPWRARAVLVDDTPVRADRNGRFAVRLRCPPSWPGHDGGCRGTLTAKHGRSPVTFDVAPGEAGAVRVRLTSRALRRVRRHGSLAVALQATTRDGTPAGTPTAGTLEVRLR